MRFPFICLLIYWVAFFVVGALNKPYFFGFLYGMASVLVVTLLFIGWWWLNRGLRLWEKCAGFALVIIEAWLVGRFSHRSVNFFAFWMSGLPLVTTAIVAWLFLSKSAKISFEKTGFAIAVTLVWSYFLLIRKRTWKEGRYGRGQVMLLRDQGLLLVSSETGDLVLLAADPAAHRELASFQALRGKSWNHPVVISDRVYLRNAQEMACYSLAK